MIENNADITIVMRKLQEFEMFKRLILDKEQERLFRSLPKPNLANLDIVEEESIEENSFDFEEKRFKRLSSQKELKSIKINEEEEIERRKSKIELESEVAYSDLKNRKDDDIITKKLVKAYEDTIVHNRNLKKQKRRETAMGNFSLEKWEKKEFMRELAKKDEGDVGSDDAASKKGGGSYKSN